MSTVMEFLAQVNERLEELSSVKIIERCNVVLMFSDGNSLSVDDDNLVVISPKILDPMQFSPKAAKELTSKVHRNWERPRMVTLKEFYEKQKDMLLSTMNLIDTKTTPPKNGERVLVKSEFEEGYIEATYFVLKDSKGIEYGEFRDDSGFRLAPLPSFYSPISQTK